MDENYAYDRPDSRTGNTILIVEDDAAIAQIIMLTISEETRYQVHYVTTPQEALQIINSIHPLLLLIDYQLPGMNGLQLYDILHTKTELKDIPAIIMSANLPWKELKKRYLVGLEKPFDLDYLLYLIEKTIL
jgi:CheY-like chemotaxis protein